MPRARATATLAALAGGLPATGTAAFVHFAVHGSADPAAGLGSGIQLADGPLTARQVLGLRLDSRLVFLGACDTGISERRAGDGLLGLIRSAIYAGSPSVMASLWPVDQLSSTIGEISSSTQAARREPQSRCPARVAAVAAAGYRRDALDYLTAASQRGPPATRA